MDEQTLNELLDAVTGGFTSLSDIDSQGFDGLARSISSLGDSINALVEGGGTSQGEISTVTVSQEQFSVIESGMRLMVTEGFVLCCLLAVSCGLTAWRIFSGGWRG